MTTLHISIDLDNDAFLPAPSLEVVRILSRYVQNLQVEQQVSDRLLLDANGNRVGEATIVK